ncbi:hypothetical protein [Pseudomonas sp. 37 R 15]|jgi:hypothetical protein|nr:hypothetical protein [Pseudomonas sp. 37 R 15]
MYISQLKTEGVFDLGEAEGQRRAVRRAATGTDTDP